MPTESRLTPAMLEAGLATYYLWQADREAGANLDRTHPRARVRRIYLAMALRQAEDRREERG